MAIPALRVQSLLQFPVLQTFPLAGDVPRGLGELVDLSQLPTLRRQTARSSYTKCPRMERGREGLNCEGARQTFLLSKLISRLEVSGP